MKYIYVEHEDIEQFREHMFVDANVYQMSQGPLQAFRKSLVLDNVSLFYRQEGAAIVATCLNLPDQYLVSIPLLDIIVNGKELTMEQLFVIAPNEVIHHPIPEDFQAFGICFSKKQAQRYLSSDLLNAISKNSEAVRANKIALPFIAEFKANVIALYEELFEKRELLNAEQISEYEKQLFLLIEQLFSPLLQNSKSTGHFIGSRRNIVSRAIEYIIDNDIDDIPVQELADKCFCSMRSLEYAFKSIYQITPKQFLTIRRLHIVRGKIKAQEFVTLKDLMLDMGISNPGRFSAQYFKLFAEYPKETWSRFKAQ